MKNSVSGFFALSVLVLGAATPAAAHLVTISSSGLWAENAPTTAYSAHNESYSFTFKVEQTYLVSYADRALKQTTTFQSYQYKLNGAIVSSRPINITFFSASLDGGLALSYADHSVELIGPDIGSSGTISMGKNIFFHPNIDYVGNSGGVINEGGGSLSAVPEPGTWVLCFAGLAAVGGMMRVRRRGEALTAA